MSITITDEQFQEINRYLAALQNGDGFKIMNEQPLNNKLVEFMASLRGHPTPDENEATIRANLRIWSTLSP
jgi:hypothetical protein